MNIETSVKKIDSKKQNGNTVWQYEVKRLKFNCKKGKMEKVKT